MSRQFFRLFGRTSRTVFITSCSQWCRWHPFASNMLASSQMKRGKCSGLYACIYLVNCPLRTLLSVPAPEWHPSPEETAWTSTVQCLIVVSTGDPNPQFSQHARVHLDGECLGLHLSWPLLHENSDKNESGGNCRPRFLFHLTQDAEEQLQL